VLVTPSAGLVQAGIRAGDVVVALDGYRVLDGNHYGSVKALGIGPKMVLTVWHDGRYVEIEEKRDRINYFKQ
jgi:S1-C subfamily serine protease